MSEYIKDRKFYTDLIEDHDKLPNFIDHFEKEIEIAKTEIVMTGRLENLAKEIPHLMDKRFTQLQIINAAIEYFEKQLDQTKSKHFRRYLENYNKVLSSRDVEKYVAGEQDVVKLSLLINELALVRNVFISITKGIDAKSFQIHNITKLRVAGIEDAMID